MKQRLPEIGEEKALLLHEGENSASWFTAFKHSWRTALKIDRSKLTTIPAIRSTIGFVLPLAIGVATGHVIEGVSLAGGAATVGSVGLTSTYRSRTRTMLLASAGIAFSAFIGSITGPIAWLSILVAGIWGIGAGMLVSLSQPMMVIGLQSALALIILSHFALDPFHALLQAALMFAGAVLQTILAIVPVPWQQTAPEREALSTLYQKLADYAVQLPQEQNGQEVRDALLQAYSTVTDSNLQSRQGKIFYGLLEEAERIRLSLIVLTRTRRYVAEAMPEQTDGVQYMDQLLHSTAATLQDIAHDLRATPRFFRITQPHKNIKDALTALRKQNVPPQAKDILRGTLAYADALRNQLHNAKKLAKSWRYRQQNAAVNVRVPRQTRLRLRDARTTLRANLTLRSSAFRHAIRLGVALALATAISHLFLTSEERGYWIVLTVLLVLKPDFTATFARGVARTLGTILGAVLTTLVVSLLVPDNTVLVILVGLMAYLAFSVLFANYAMFSVFITTETVLLLTFVIPQPLMTTAYRAIDTTIGGILALLIYALWPTWERARVMPNIAQRIEAIRQYFVEVMKAYTKPGAYDTLALHNRLMEARLARSNAEASVERSLQEPEPHRIDANLAYGLLGAAEHIIQRVLTLEAYLIDNPKRHAFPELTHFASCVDEALHTIATSVQNEQPVTGLPDLEEALQTLKHAEKSRKRSAGEERADLSLVITEAKGIIRNIHIMKSLLSTKAASRPRATQTLQSSS